MLFRVYSDTKSRSSSKKNICFFCTATRNSRCSWKFCKFRRKHLCWSFFLMKLQVFRSATLLKWVFNTGVFLWNLQRFYEHLFTEHLRWLFLNHKIWFANWWLCFILGISPCFWIPKCLQKDFNTGVFLGNLKEHLFTEHLWWLFVNHKICLVCAGKLVVMFYLGNSPMLLNVEDKMNLFVFNKLVFVNI